jgi:DNA replication and repair protein RecF
MAHSRARRPAGWYKPPVHLTSLTLASFRNYSRLDLAAGPGVILLLGQNAQGKTNVLEAIALLATGRSERTESDADLIAWPARDDPQPFARIAATAQRASDHVAVELTVVGRPGARGLIASKRFKVNGIARRAADATGNILAVLFTTDDMDLVKGAPAGRRRFVDTMLVQADRAYARALSRYGKVVTQRNALLKQLQERHGDPEELTYWDAELAAEAATIVSARAQALARLSDDAGAVHAALASGREAFAVSYAPRFGEGWDAARIVAAAPDELREAFAAKLHSARARDIAAGITLSGPHRDDLEMTIDGEPAASAASRGQQRTAALALRLGEARYLHAVRRERPLLLLDDVLSELDEDRRAAVLAATEADQTWITSPDPDRFAPEFVAKAQVYRVQRGTLSRM